MCPAGLWKHSDGLMFTSPLTAAQKLVVWAQRRSVAGRAFAHILPPGTPAALHGDLSKARFALVTSGPPHAPLGWPLVLEHLLGPVPEHELLVVGPEHRTWDGRPRVDLYSADIFHNGGPRLRRLLNPATQVEAWRTSLLLRTKGLRLRRVLATLDRMLPLAQRLAEDTGADLWIYAIDDHASMLPRHMWKPAFQRASRVFALSAMLARHVEENYQRNRVEVLPPLTVMPTPVPIPSHAALKLLFLGSVQGYHREVLQWMAAWATNKPNVELHLVTPRRDWEAFGWTIPASWKVSCPPTQALGGHIADATVACVFLDTTPSNAAQMTVAFPTKLRDYLAHGRPVLALAPSGSTTSEVILAQKLGWVAQDQNSLVTALDALAVCPMEELAAIGRRSHAYARAYLDLDVQGRAWLGAFTS